MLPNTQFRDTGMPAQIAETIVKVRALQYQPKT